MGGSPAAWCLGLGIDLHGLCLRGHRSAGSRLLSLPRSLLFKVGQELTSCCRGHPGGGRLLSGRQSPGPSLAPMDFVAGAIGGKRQARGYQEACGSSCPTVVGWEGPRKWSGPTVGCRGWKEAQGVGESALA